MKYSFILTAALLTVLFAPACVMAKEVTKRNVESIMLDQDCDACILKCVLATKPSHPGTIKECADTKECADLCRIR